MSSIAAAAPFISGSHYEEEKAAACNGATACQINFAQPAAGKFVVITRVSCFATINATPVRIVIAARSGSGSLSRSDNLTPVLISQTSGLSQFVSESATRFLFPPGAPTVVLTMNEVATSAFMRCKITGEIRNAAPA